MILYHYSKELYDVLKSRAAQKDMPPTNTPDMMYDRSISFFIEPIPLDILPSLHHYNHHFYKDKSKVYEYQISDHDLNKDKFVFRLVESPEKTQLYYDDSILDKEYHERLNAAIKEFGYTGTTTREIEPLVRRFKGTTRDLFKKLPTYPNYETDLKTKYAPLVPHLMIYFNRGVIPYSSVAQKVMGK